MAKSTICAECRKLTVRYQDILRNHIKRMELISELATSMRDNADVSNEVIEQIGVEIKEFLFSLAILNHAVLAIPANDIDEKVIKEELRRMAVHFGDS